MSTAKKTATEPVIDDTAAIPAAAADALNNEAANINKEAPSGPDKSSTDVPNVAGDIAKEVANTVELGPRPKPFVPKMSTMENQIRLGRDSIVSTKLAEDMRDEVRTLAKNILNGKATGLGLATLSEIESNAELTRNFKVSVGQLVVNSLGNSKEHKALRKAINKASSASGIMTVVDSYSGSDKKEIENLFMEGLLAMYGLVNPDNVSAVLSTSKITLDGKEIAFTTELTSLLGGAPNENNNAGAVIRRIMYKEALLAAGDPDKAKKVAENFQKCRLAKPIDAKSEDPVFKDTMAEISKFREAITDSKKTLTDANIVKEANEPELAKYSAKMDVVSASLSAKTTEVDDLTVKVKNAELQMQNLRARGSGLTPDERKTLDSLSAVFQIDSQRLLKAEKEKSELERTHADLQKSIDVASGGSGEQRVALLRAKSAFIDTITNFVAHIDRRLAQMKNANTVVDIKPYAQLQALRDAVSNMSATKIDDQSSYLEASIGGISNILNIVQELSGFALAISERKNFSAEELAMAYLKNKYVDLGYSEQQAEMAAIIEYTRTERESKLAQFQVKANEAKAQKMDGFFSRTWKEKVKGTAEYVTAEKAMVLCARNPRAEVEIEEHTAIEGLVGLNNFKDLRSYLLQGKISRNALTTYMYELMSLVGGRQIDDGTFITLKTASDIGKVESMVLNISKFLAEDSALEIIKRAEDASATPENGALSRAELVAKTLKSYNDDLSNTEILLATRAFTSDSSILTKAKIKQGIKDILAQIEESGMTKEQFMAELQRHGLSGLENGFALTRFRLNQIGRVLKRVSNSAWDRTKLVGSTMRDKTREAYERRGEIARTIGRGIMWPIKAPFRLAAWGIKLPFRVLGSAIRGTSRAIGTVVGGATTATTFALLTAGRVAGTAAALPFGAVKAVTDGAKYALKENTSKYVHNLERYGKLGEKPKEEVADDSEQKAA